MMLQKWVLSQHRGVTLSEYTIIFIIVVIVSVSGLVALGGAVNSRAAQLACMFLGGMCGGGNGGDGTLALGGGIFGGGLGGGGGTGGSTGSGRNPTQPDNYSTNAVAEYVEAGGSSGAIDKALEQLQQMIDKLKQEDPSNPEISRLQSLVDAGHNVSKHIRSTEDQLNATMTANLCIDGCYDGQREQESQITKQALSGVESAQSAFEQMLTETLNRIKDDPTLANDVDYISQDILQITKSFQSEADQMRAYLTGDGDSTEFTQRVNEMISKMTPNYDNGESGIYADNVYAEMKHMVNEHIQSELVKSRSNDIDNLDGPGPVVSGSEGATP